MRPIKTDLLIVGAGPAGGSLACFLASYGPFGPSTTLELKTDPSPGKTGMIIAASSGTADTPRAHITNAAALECFRDIGLERNCIDAASHGDNMQHTRWCRSMAGEEFARIFSWGHDPQRMGDYIMASPCRHVDLPQTELEPILVRRATHAGWKICFNTTFVAIRESTSDQVTSELRDNVTNTTYLIQSRFLFGCDGARSQVVRELQLPLIKQPHQGVATNVLVKADMSALVKNRNGNLHWVFDPEKEHPLWGWTCTLQMVRPWDEWMFIFLPRPGADGRAPEMTATKNEYLAKVKEIIGDESIEAEITDVSKWWINEVVAERYSDGNVFCLGDAVHRHPPFNGLGSNTCVQDAFNLAWKVSYIMSGQADRKLLDSYSAERQPVGAGIVARANQGLRDHIPWMTLIGLLEEDVQERRRIVAEFSSKGEEGRKRRQAWKKAIENTATEFHGLGIEMNQQYASSAVYQADESCGPPASQQPVNEYLTSTYPGKRLPHAWLNTRKPGFPVSTIDLGRGGFALLIGPGGEQWRSAAAETSKKLGVKISSHSIGWNQDLEDVYFDWARLREVEEHGCVLVRPDRFVAWRSLNLVADCSTKLEHVMKSILSLA